MYIDFYLLMSGTVKSIWRTTPSVNKWDVCKRNVLLIIRMHFTVYIVVSWFRKNHHAGWLLVGVQVSPTSERRVHYCPTLNLFAVYRRRAAKWYPILWWPYVVYGTSGRLEGEGTPLRTRHMLLHHVAHCRRGATPALCWVGTISVSERRAQREHIMGSSNRVPLDTQRLGPLFNRVWSLPPSRWLASRHVNVLLLMSHRYDAHFAAWWHLE